VLHRARLGDRRGDRGVATDERDCHLDEPDASLVREARELVGSVEFSKRICGW
jgi:hypothetical protein